MDRGTGTIKRFDTYGELDKAIESGDFVEVKASEPDRKCKRCYGRGHTGRNLTTGLYEPCRCLNREIDDDF